MQQLKGDGMSTSQRNLPKQAGSLSAKLLAGKKALVALGCAGTLGLAAAGITGLNFWQSQPAFAQDLSNAPSTFANVAEKVRPAVVSIFTKGTASPESTAREFSFPEVPPDHPFHDFFEQFRRKFPNGTPHPRQPLERAQGSGFLISSDGYIVTNHHVVDKASEISVTFESEEKYDAKVIGTDERTDLALLKIQSDKTFDHFIEFAAKTPRVGDWVLAVGNPFGLGGTVTAGIVSADGRSLGAGPYDFIQIDAAVNRGNSGGPAVNLSGEVIGVNTAIYSPSGGNVGIAFAIPSQLAKTVVDQLKSSGKVSRGWLGVTIQDVNEDIAESLGMKVAKGALITRIMDDGPSAKSELKVRDVVVKVNGEDVDSSRDLARKIADLQPNSESKLSVLRDGKDQTITVKLGTFPSSDKLAALTGQNDDDGSDQEQMKDLGLTLAPAEDVEGVGGEGVAITDVDPVSEAADKGLKAGDIILEVGGKRVSTPNDVSEGVREATRKGRKAVLLQLQSNRETRFIALSLNKKED